MKFRVYAGETLHDVLVTLKIDGVRAHGTEGGVVSRAGKPLHNLSVAPGVIAEVFCGSWESTVSAVRSRGAELVPAHFVYTLLPEMDPRLVVRRCESIAASEVEALFLYYRAKGYEGLVLHAAEGRYKVKGAETHDVLVTGVVAGRGKHCGRMGALMTEKGKVGTGFTDADRELEWAPGMVVEVACMELTPGGKFRHPRFKRRRFDKESTTEEIAA
jgi:hypothetical protein